MRILNFGARSQEHRMGERARRFEKKLILVSEKSGVRSRRVTRLPSNRREGSIRMIVMNK
jgi:hypothetical protein